MKRKFFLISTVVALLAVGTFSTLSSMNSTRRLLNTSEAETSTYTMSIGSSAFASLGESYTRAASFRTSSQSSGGYDIQLNVVNGKRNGENLELAKLGRIFNFDANSSDAYSAIHDIKSIKVVFTGGLSLRMALRKDGNELGPKQALTSDTPLNVENLHSNYFLLEAGTSGAVISNIEIKYSCAEVSDFSIEQFNGFIYTGNGDDNYIYRMTISGTNVSFMCQNKNGQPTYNGTVAVQNNKLVCSLTIATYSAVYSFIPSADLSSLTFDSKTGTAAPMMPMVNMDRVYVFEDYESYSDTGTGYTASNSEFNRSGLQGAYFSDYAGGGNTSPVGTSGFQLMGSTDFIQLESTNTFMGSKSGKYKVNGAAWMRHWQYGQLYGEPYIEARGAKISMWLKNPNSTNVSMKWGAMTTNAVLNNTTRNTGDFASVTVPANSDWTEYTINVTGHNIYGWYLAFEKSASGSTVRVYVDQVTVYTTSPYDTEEPVVPVDTQYCKTLTVNDGLLVADSYSGLLGTSVSFLLALGKNGTGYGWVLGQKVTVNSYTAQSDGTFALDTTFSYSSPLGNVTITSITGIQSDSGLTNVTFAGNLIGSLLKENGSISLAPHMAMSDGLDGTTDTLKATYERWYNGGSWTKDTNNADKIQASSNGPIEGAGCMSVRGYSKFRITLKQDLPAATALKGMGVWVRNDGSKDYTIKFFVYKATGLSSSAYDNPFSGTLPADGQWHYFQSGFDTSHTFYNFAIYFDNGSAVAADRVSIDYLHVF